jgi:hypothetical protein
MARRLVAASIVAALLVTPVVVAPAVLSAVVVAVAVLAAVVVAVARFAAFVPLVSVMAFAPGLRAVVEAGAEGVAPGVIIIHGKSPWVEVWVVVSVCVYRIEFISFSDGDTLPWTKRLRCEVSHRGRFFIGQVAFGRSFGNEKAPHRVVPSPWRMRVLPKWTQCRA